MNEWLAVAGVGLGGTVLTFLIMRLFQGRPKAKPVDDEAPPEMVFGDLTNDLGQMIPPGGQGKQDLQQALRAAGFYERNALMSYSAVRYLLTFLPLVGGLLLALLLDGTGMYYALGGAFMTALFGFSIPRVWLSFKTCARLREIEKGLPAAIDLMTLSLSAGQTLQASLEMAGKELRSTFPPMSVELQITHHHSELHSLEYALIQLADRIRMSDIRNLTLMLIQSVRLGTDTASTLLEFAANMRVTMKQRADHRANQASFWLLIPSVCCLWVAAAIVLVGPAYMEFMRYRTEASELLSKGRITVESSNDPAGVRRPAGNTPAPGPIP